MNNLLTLAAKARQDVECLCKFEEGSEDLAGYCGIAAYYLHQLAKARGIETALVVGTFYHDDRDISGHAWIEYQDWIIDITATQFAQYDRQFDRQIYVSDAENSFYHPFYVNKDAISCIGDWYQEENLELLCLQLDKRVFSEPVFDLLMKVL
jgi:hypothetical protein